MASDKYRAAAEWMESRLQAEQMLDQQDAAYGIQSEFGDDVVYINDNGNTAISPRVLKEFRRLTESTAVWNRSERYWRLREPSDEIGKRSTDY